MLAMATLHSSQRTHLQATSFPSIAGETILTSSPSHHRHPSRVSLAPSLPPAAIALDLLKSSSSQNYGAGFAMRGVVRVGTFGDAHL